MYTDEIFKIGIEVLGITDGLTIAKIHTARTINLIDLEFKAERNRQSELWHNRFKVPHDLQKKEYKALLKDTQSEINRLKELARTHPEVEEEQDRYIKKKNLIKRFIEGDKPEELNIEKAKAYPVNQIIDFDHRGFRKCLWHDEKTPSFRYNKTRNKAHCFSCGLDVDSIDVYMKFYNVPFNIAVKTICQMS